MKQDYIIADLRIRMDTFGRTLEQAKEYSASFVGEPDMVIHSNPTELRERQPHLSLDDCEYLSSGRDFYRSLIRFDGIMLHASAVVMDGYAYLFSAPCGTGKSTHTALWREVYGDRVTILNDDKPALRRIGGEWYAYGTPWSGKTAQNANVRARLGGICVLKRGEDNCITPYSGNSAAFSLLEQTVRPQDDKLRKKLLELVALLLSEVPIWKLRCTPKPEAAVLSHDVMSAELKTGGGKLP